MCSLRATGTVFACFVADHFGLRESSKSTTGDRQAAVDSAVRKWLDQLLPELVAAAIALLVLGVQAHWMVGGLQPPPILTLVLLTALAVLTFPAGSLLLPSNRLLHEAQEAIPGTAQLVRGWREGVVCLSGDRARLWARLDEVVRPAGAFVSSLPSPARSALEHRVTALQALGAPPK